jgi:hypothetical protein
MRLMVGYHHHLLALGTIASHMEPKLGVRSPPTQITLSAQPALVTIVTLKMFTHHLIAMT